MRYKLRSSLSTQTYKMSELTKRKTERERKKERKRKREGKSTI